MRYGLHVIRIDPDCFEVLEAYRAWLEEQRLERVTMADAVRELLVKKAKELRFQSLEN